MIIPFRIRGYTCFLMKSKKLIIIINLILFIIGIYYRSNADEIKLRDGKSIYGKIIEITSRDIKYRDGKTKETVIIPQEGAKRIIYLKEETQAMQKPQPAETTAVKPLNAHFYFGFDYFAGGMTTGLDEPEDDVNFADGWLWWGLDSGIIINNHFMTGLHVYIGSWSNWYQNNSGGEDYTFSYEIYEYRYYISYYPVPGNSKIPDRYFIKAGTGIAHLLYETDHPDYIKGYNDKVNTYGMTYLVGFGYSFSLSGFPKSFLTLFPIDTRITIGIDYSYQRYFDNEIIQKTHTYRIYSSAMMFF